MGLLQGLIDKEIRALAQCRLLGHRLGGAGAGSGDDLAQAALWPTGPVRAVDDAAAAAAAPTTVAARRLCVPGVLEDGVPTAPFGLGREVAVVITAISSPFPGTSRAPGRCPRHPPV